MVTPEELEEISRFLNSTQEETEEAIPIPVDMEDDSIDDYEVEQEEVAIDQPYTATAQPVVAPLPTAERATQSFLDIVEELSRESRNQVAMDIPVGALGHAAVHTAFLDEVLIPTSGVVGPPDTNQ
jgi:hypothetical protein